MATLPIVLAQMDALLQANTIVMLGLPAPQSQQPGVSDPSYYAVRVGWQQQGQPAFKITEDVTFVRAVEEDDQYNRVRDVSYSQATSGNPPVTTTTKTTKYTRVWRVFWTVYGPNSFDHARKLRSRLFDQDVHDLFSSSQLYLVTDPSAPIRAPEQKVAMGAWWERVDFSARFNEAVTENYSTSAVESVEVIVSVADGVIADFVIDPDATPEDPPPDTQYTPPYPVYLAPLDPAVPTPEHVPRFWYPQNAPDGERALLIFLAAPPNVDSVQIFLNGLLQCPGQDYTAVVVGNSLQVTMTIVPTLGSIVLAYF